MNKRPTQTLYAILSFAFILMMGAGRLCAQTAIANTLQHPKDQIALQLGAIQMGYTVPFTLTGNITAQKMQEAVNALVMGRNALDATVAKPAVKVVGAVDSPSVETVEYRDQLYAAVEYVVTSPVVATIKGSTTLTGNKKVSVVTKLTLPTNAWTIPVPYALESRSSADVQELAGSVTALTGSQTALSANVTNLASQVVSISGNLSNTATTISGLSGNVTSLSTQVSSISSNVINTATAVAALSQNVSAVTENGADLKSLLISSGIIRDYSTKCTVTTLAGGGEGVSTNGTGAAASFNGPQALAVDSIGNVYVADMNSNIRKITSAGVVTTLAAYEGPDWSRWQATLGLAVDDNGNVYLSDSVSRKIRKITSAGVVTTLAGSGVAGSIDGTGTAASFQGPSGIALDSSGNLYVADVWNIRKITPAGVVTTFAGGAENGVSIDGTGTAASFSQIWNIAVDSSNTVYVTEEEDSGRKIRKITPTGVVTTFANLRTVYTQNLLPVDGNITAASVGYVGPIAVDISGNLYLSDPTCNMIRKITPAGVVSTLAGGVDSTYQGFRSDGSSVGKGYEARFNFPTGIATDRSGNVYVADQYNNRIQKITISQ